MASSTHCAYCGKELFGEIYEEPDFPNPTDTGPWYYHIVIVTK
jgi:hypothetical protein